MFTSKENVLKQLESEGWSGIILEFIDKGVMTDTYMMTSGDKKYAVRCFPDDRRWLAKVENDYLMSFAKNGVKAPLPVAINASGHKISYVIYEWVEGETLNVKYDTLTDEERACICDEIVDNYNRITQIKQKKFGTVSVGGLYEHVSWVNFLKKEIKKSRRIFKLKKNKVYVQICDGLYDYTETIEEPEECLVWSDFSLENIIINSSNHLAAFIDFEGMMSGDPVLGYSYLLAHEPDHDFTKRIIDKVFRDNPGIHKLLDFYAVFRYTRLYPYTEGLTPNNSQREPIQQFLPYVPLIENQFRVMNNSIKRLWGRLKDEYKAILILCLTTILCVFAVWIALDRYEPVISKTQTSVVMSIMNPKLEFQRDVPSWFYVRNDTLMACKVIDDNDKTVLKSLVVKNDSVADSPMIKSYYSAIDELAYKSKTNNSDPWNLFFLTLCLVYLGCCARTLYDYIGWKCYKGGQDMETWWPWYVFRPVLGVSIAAFLIFVVRTSMFSSLFSSKDLNSYLVVSFLAGFAMMEFLKLLRRTSKALFGGDEKN